MVFPFLRSSFSAMAGMGPCLGVPPLEVVTSSFFGGGPSPSATPPTAHAQQQGKDLGQEESSSFLDFAAKRRTRRKRHFSLEDYQDEVIFLKKKPFLEKLFVSLYRIP